jgi:hypothetical protein
VNEEAMAQWGLLRQKKVKSQNIEDLISTAVEV